MCFTCELPFVRMWPMLIYFDMFHIQPFIRELDLLNVCVCICMYVCMYVCMYGKGKGKGKVLPTTGHEVPGGGVDV